MRPYNMPKNFPSWESISQKFEKLNNIFVAFHRELNDNNMDFKQILKTSAYLHQQWWGSPYPLYCIRENILKAMQETDLGEKIALFQHIELSMPYYVLIFPKKSVKAPAGGYLDYLVVHHKEVNHPEFKYLLQWTAMSGNEIVISQKHIRKDGTIKLSLVLADEDQQVEAGFAIRNIVLQSLLLLQHFDEVEDFSPDQEKKLGFGGKIKKRSSIKTPEFALPRWLGKKNKEYIRKGPSSDSGGGGKLAPHYRRGTWRLQPCGVGRKEVRLTWVSPCRVNW